MHIQFAELPVLDQDRAKKFYSDYLDCHVVADESMGDNWRWIELGFEGAQTHLHFVPRDGSVRSDDPVLVLIADDVAAEIERLRATGVEISSEPQETPWEPGRIAAEFLDSEGNRIVVSSS